MICMETIAKVRRWVKADGLSIKEVVRRTGLSRNTVRKYLRDEHVEPQYRMSTPRGSRRLLDHEVHLKGMYEGDLAKPSRERRSMQGLYEALVCEGYTGSYDTVRRYIVTRIMDKLIVHLSAFSEKNYSISVSCHKDFSARPGRFKVGSAANRPSSGPAERSNPPHATFVDDQVGKIWQINHTVALVSCVFAVQKLKKLIHYSGFVDMPLLAGHFL